MSRTTAAAAVLSSSSTPLTPPAIGQVWPGQGGIYAGIMRGAPGQPDYHLILSPKDVGQFDRMEFGEYGLHVPNADSDWDGLGNTKALLASKREHPAAEKCAAIQHEGHNDYYLPARNEAALLYALVRDELHASWHWTSTQYSPHGAWVSYFNGGTQLYGLKGTGYRVRAVRRVSIQ